MKEKALMIVEREFAGIVDKAGAPYINHLLFVAEKAKEVAIEFGLDPEIHEVAGLLHDLVEDIDHWTVDRVAMEFGEEVAEIVDYVSKRPEEKGVNRPIYLARLKGNIGAIVVKIADTLHNSDFTRFANPDEATIAKSNGYGVLCVELIELLNEKVN